MRTLSPIRFRWVLGLVFLVSFLAIGPPNVRAVKATAGKWDSLKTKYLTLTFENAKELEVFNEKIIFSSENSSFSSFLNADQPSGTGIESEVIQKVDALVEKVQLILDMRKPINIIVKLYPDKTALQGAYFQIYKEKRQLRAWYIFEYNTIYLNVQDLYSGMLAHEIAHAIVNNYLAVRPPRATAEILARYVDKHLYKKAKVY